MGSILSGLAVGLFVLAALCLLLPSLSDIFSLLKANSTRRVSRKRRRDDDPRPLLFLIPARDEELLITSCLDALERLPDSDYEICVIADNCSDRTAALADSRGAKVLRRTSDHIGKGYALVWALEKLPVRRYDAIIVLDADSLVDASFVSALRRSGDLPSRVVQTNVAVRNPADAALTRMSEVHAVAQFRLAFNLKARAGLNVPLTGNGMCIGRDVLERQPWTATSAVEDSEQYLLWTLAGVHIELRNDATVYAQEPVRVGQARTQRLRWRRGRLNILFNYWKAMVRARKCGLHQRLDMISELLMPGPVAHLGIVVVLGAAYLLLGLPARAWILVALGASLLRPTAYAILALTAVPKPLAALGSFVLLPAYAAWRLAAELQAVLRLGNRAWTRTPRHAPMDDDSPTTTLEKMPRDSDP